MHHEKIHYFGWINNISSPGCLPSARRKLGKSNIFKSNIFKKSADMFSVHNNTNTQIQSFLCLEEILLQKLHLKITVIKTVQFLQHAVNECGIFNYFNNNHVTQRKNNKVTK